VISNNPFYTSPDMFLTPHKAPHNNIMRSWAQIVKATAHIPIPPPAPLVPKPKREVLCLGGNEYAIYKAKKEKEKTKKEEEERKNYWAQEKATEEFWNKVEKEQQYTPLNR